MEEKRGDTNEKQGRGRLKGEAEVRRRLNGRGAGQTGRVNLKFSQEEIEPKVAFEPRRI